MLSSSPLILTCARVCVCERERGRHILSIGHKFPGFRSASEADPLTQIRYSKLLPRVRWVYDIAKSWVHAGKDSWRTILQFRRGVISASQVCVLVGFLRLRDSDFLISNQGEWWQISKPRKRDCFVHNIITARFVIFFSLTSALSNWPLFHSWNNFTQVKMCLDLAAASCQLVHSTQ